MDNNQPACDGYGKNFANNSLCEMCGASDECKKLEEEKEIKTK